MALKQNKKLNKRSAGKSRVSQFEKVMEVVLSPFKALHRRFPNLPTIGSLFEKIGKFSLRRKFLELCLKSAEEKNDKKGIEKFQKKIEELDSVKHNVLFKYIAKELFVYFIVAFLFFFVIFFVNQILLLAETILKKRVPVASVLKLIWYCLPAIVAQSAPFATLVGFLMCLGRMVTDNEVLILRASGLRYIKILSPVIILGIGISLFSYVMNDYFLPLGTINYNKLYRQIIVSNPSIEMESHSIKRMNDSTLVIGEVDKNNISDLVFFDTAENGDQRIIISKETDVQKAVSPGVLMQLNMDDAIVMILDKKNRKNYDVLDSDELTLNVFESSIISNNGSVSPREMTSYDLYKEIEKMKAKEETSKKQLNTYNLEFNKKFSIPFGSIFFALLAFPLALVFGKKDGQTLGFIFGIIISVLYWAATILGQMFGIRSGYNGFWMMWGPNFFVGIVGIFLYFRLRRK